MNIHKLHDKILESNKSPLKLLKELCEGNDTVSTTWEFNSSMTTLTAIRMEAASSQRK